MTTDEMKLAIMWHFKWKLWYPLVITEGELHYRSKADVLAIRKTMAVEVEIKKEFCEISRDLKVKHSKHNFYLTGLDSTRIPNKFYFALPSGFKDATLEKYKEIIPKPYGLIVVEDDDFRPHHCRIVKYGLYLTRYTDHLENLNKMISHRLAAENIDLRLKLMEKSKCNPS